VKRLARWTLNGLTVLSLMLCVPTTLLYVRSHSAYDEVRFATVGGRLFVLGSGNGKLKFATIRGWPPIEPLRWQTLAGGRDPDGLPMFSIGPRDAKRCVRLGQTRLDATFSPSWRAGVARTMYRIDGRPPAPGEWLYWTTDVNTLFTRPLPYYERTVFHGAVVLLFAALPAAWLLCWLVREIPRAMRDRKVAQGLCLSCSYDLTGNVSGVCPECGTAIAKGTT
jgi:hypothetical protein